MEKQNRVVSRTFAILIDPKGWFDCHQEPVFARIKELGFNIVDHSCYGYDKKVILARMEDHKLPAGLLGSELIKELTKDMHHVLYIEKEGSGVAEEFAAAVGHDPLFVGCKSLFYPRNTDESDRLIDVLFERFSLRTVKKFDETFPEAVDVEEEYKSLFTDTLRYCDEITEKTNVLGGFTTKHTVICGRYDNGTRERRANAWFRWIGPEIDVWLYASLDACNSRYEVLIAVALDTPSPRGNKRKLIHERQCRSIKRDHMSVIKGKLTEHFNHKVYKTELV